MKPTTIAEIKVWNADNNGIWFSPETMRFFGTRLNAKVYLDEKNQRTIFVSSEQYGDSYPRNYSVRAISWRSGRINAIGGHGQYHTRADAHKAAKAAVGGEA